VDEATWEPLQILYEDVPKMLTDFLKRQDDELSKQATVLLNMRQRKQSQCGGEKISEKEGEVLGNPRKQ
jgi:hypothetical protein